MFPANLVGGGKNSNGDKFKIDEKGHLVNLKAIINSIGNARENSIVISIK